MKTTYTLAMVTTLALGGAALAQPGAHGPHGKLERLDADKDGKVTLAEMKSEAGRKFAQLDADKNGRVTEAEITAHHEQMRAEFAQKHADKRAAGKWAHKRHGGDCGGMKGRMLEKLDANGDGNIERK